MSAPSALTLPIFAPGVTTGAAPPFLAVTEALLPGVGVAHSPPLFSFPTMTTPSNLFPAGLASCCGALPLLAPPPGDLPATPLLARAAAEVEE